MGLGIDSPVTLRTILPAVRRYLDGTGCEESPDVGGVMLFGVDASRSLPPVYRPCGGHTVRLKKLPDQDAGRDGQNGPQAEKA
jgi:hypothetical protein